MASWKKLLWQMAADTSPRGYTYEDAARILRSLAFEEPTKRNGSHRLWRLRLADGNVAYVGLVQKGHGTMKPGYIRDMVAELRKYDLIPHETEGSDDELDN